MHLSTDRTPSSVEPELYCFEDYVPKETVQPVSPTSTGSHANPDVAETYSPSHEKENYFFSQEYDR